MSLGLEFNYLGLGLGSKLMFDGVLVTKEITNQTPSDIDVLPNPNPNHVLRLNSLKQSLHAG